MSDTSKRTELELLALAVAENEVLDIYDLNTDLFTDPEYANLLLAIKNLHERSERKNKTNLQVALKGLKLTVKKTTVELLFNTKPESSAKLAYETVLNLWKTREAKKTIEGLTAEMETTSPEEIGEVLTEGAQKLDVIAQNEEIDGSSADDMIESFIQDTKSVQLLEPGIKTGFQGIDSTFNGFKAGQMWIIAGGTGIGKTTFAMNCAYNMATEGHNVGFLSLEMTKEEVMNKIFAMHTEHSVNAIERRDVPKEVIEKAKGLAGFSMYIYEMYARTVNNIVSTLVAIKRKCKAGIIFIDFISQIAHRQKNLHEGYGEIALKIKLAAQKLRIPIVVLAQTSRESNKEGYSADSIASSHGISTAAHMITILKYTDEFQDDNHIRQMQAKIVKNRLGRNFVDVPIEFNTVTQRMTEPLADIQLDSSW